MSTEKVERIKKSDLYIRNLNSDKRIRVNQGGTSSGKTWSILDLMLSLGCKYENLVMTVVAESVPNLKKGALRDCKNIINNDDIYQKFYTKYNETDRIFTSTNGSIIEFLPALDEQSAKAGKRNILFVNEANSITYDVYWQYAIRTIDAPNLKSIVFIDYNPSSSFWVHEKVIGQPDVDFIISDHWCNRFLSDEQHERIEGIEDPELWKVYACGKTGRIEGLVYNNWDIVDDVPSNYKKRWVGMDFGFTNDPTSIIDVRLSDGELWIDEICYRTGMTNTDIAKHLKQNNIDRSISIIADSADPKSIQEIYNMGFNIEGAKKGPDSINYGIDILKRYKLHITKNSVNVKKELLSYKWAEDKLGSLTGKPVDWNNHALDAIRYVALNNLGVDTRSGEYKTRTVRRRELG